MNRKIWGTAEAMPFSTATLQAAKAAGASEIMQVPNKTFTALVIGLNTILESAENHNAPILAALLEIDMRSIRALRTNDTQRLAVLESQAATLRATLM